MPRPPIEKLKLQLIEERHTNWKYLNKETLTVSAFLILTSLMVLLVFLPDSMDAWVLSMGFVFFLIFLIALPVSYWRYSFIRDHNVIGHIAIRESSIGVTKKGITTEINLQNAVLRLEYGFVRGINQFRMHDIDHGISELKIDNHSLKFIIYNHSESQHLSEFLEYWYSLRVQLTEMTRDVNKYKLIKLERDFDWSEWKEIEANNKKKASERR